MLLPRHGWGVNFQCRCTARRSHRDRAVLTTDYFFDWASPAGETLRMIVGIFLPQGLAADDIKAMLHHTPRRLLAKLASNIPRVSEPNESRLSFIQPASVLRLQGLTKPFDHGL